MYRSNLLEVYADIKRGPFPYTSEHNVADEQVTLEALQAAAQAELEAEEASSNAIEEQANDNAEEGDAGGEQTGASTVQAAQAETKGKTVQIPISKLQQQRAERREAKERQEQLQRQNEELQRQLSMIGTGGKPAVQATMPTLEQFDFDESAYQKAVAEYFSGSIDQRLAATQQQQYEQQRQQQFAQRIESDVDSHYQRVSSLGFGEDYIPAEQAVREKFGDAAVEQMISAVGEGSEKVIYHIGLNPEAMDEVAKLLQQDLTGYKALSHLGRLAERLNKQPPQKKISQAPAADRGLTGGNGASGKTAAIKLLDRLSKNPDRTRFREEKRKIIAAGGSDLLKAHGYL